LSSLPEPDRPVGDEDGNGDGRGAIGAVAGMIAGAIGATGAGRGAGAAAGRGAGARLVARFGAALTAVFLAFVFAVLLLAFTLEAVFFAGLRLALLLRAGAAFFFAALVVDFFFLDLLGNKVLPIFFATSLSAMIVLPMVAATNDLFHAPLHPLRNRSGCCPIDQFDQMNHRNSRPSRDLRHAADVAGSNDIWPHFFDMPDLAVTQLPREIGLQNVVDTGRSATEVPLRYLLENEA
jgi:hypothetical protein